MPTQHNMRKRIRTMEEKRPATLGKRAFLGKQR